MSYTPGGDIISAGGRGGSVFFMSAQTGEKILCPLNVDSYVWSVAFSPCGKTMAVGCENGKVVIVDVATVAVMRSLSGHSEAVSCLAFKPDDPNILVTGSSDETLKLWDLSKSLCLSTVTGHSDAVRGVCFSPDGSKIASCSVDKTIRMWNAQTGENIGSTGY